jgi:NAD(P)-dependent dehydrogenase (short-subunit alcohol dehydrogenase family)
VSGTGLAGRVAIVTGGAGGIGQALARAFAANGMRVAIADVAADAAARLAAELGAERALALPTDVADPQSCAACVGRAAERFGTVHVLVNNAARGMGVIAPDHFSGRVRIEDITPEAWRRMIAVNLGGAFLMARAAVPIFRAQRWGRVINVTTSFFTMLRPGFAPYGPAKAGLEAWSAGLAGELKESGITVNVVVPGGPTDTPMVPVESGVDRSLLIRPERMAPPMLYLCSEAGGSVSGMRFVAGEWDPALPDAAAAARSGAPIGWPELAQNPIWPGGKPTD